MRVLFLLLLLLNIAFFAWYSRQPVEMPPAGRTAAAAGNIVLLQERHSPPSSTVVAPPLPAVLCYRAGPFDEASLAEQFLAALPVAPERHQLKVEEGKTHAGYWVRWPQAQALAEARRIYRELQEKGVRDVAITPAGKGHYIVSLGVFRHRDTMEERRNRMAALGYSVEVADRFKTFARYWLLLEFKRAQPEVEAGLQAMQRQFPAAAFEKAACS